MNSVFRHYRAWRLPVCFCVEFFLISGAVILTATLRFSTGDFGHITGLSFIPHACLVAFVCQLCLYYADFYDLRVPLTNRKLLLKLLQSFGVASVALTVLFYLIPQLVIGRGVFLFSLALAFGGVLVWRQFYQRLHTRQQFKTNIVILGVGEEAYKLANELLHNQMLGYEVKGFICDDPDRIGERIITPCVIGTTEQLPMIVARESIDKVIVALSDRRGKLPLDSLLTCKMQGVVIEEGVTFYEQISGRIMLENLRPSWLIFSEGFSPSSPIVVSCKRVMDIVLSVVGLILSMPLMAVTAVLIKLDSQGPILFTQQRVGQHGRFFTLLKFRSMYVDAELLTGPVYAAERDHRVTRLGRFLRLYRLDELPQLFNVLTGEMSFVGPRPERPFFVKQFEKELPYFTQRLSVKPGITGWAQVNYPYGATLKDAEEKLCFDLYYIKNMSLILDLFIILKTAKIAVLGEGAR